MATENTPVKIFITIPWFFPAFRAGGPVQSVVNLVNNFKENCEYYIFCGNTDLNDEPLDVDEGKWLPFNEVTKVWYCTNNKRSDTLVKQCEIIKPDVLMVVGIYSWHFTLVPLLYCKAPKKIISVRGMLHPGALSQKNLKKKIYFSVWNLFGFQHKAVFHATDEVEKEIILEHFSEDLAVEVAANYPRLYSRSALPAKSRGELKLVSVALISPMKNHLLIIQALNKCKANIEYHIYGPVKDKDYWNECKELIVKLPLNIKVQYHGEISPEDVEGALKNNHVFILPSKSENYGHAFIEALSAGLPVISSNNIPWLKLNNSKAGWNVASEKEDLVKAIDFFSDMNQEEMEEWSEGAFQYSRTCVDLKSINNQYFQLFFNNKESEDKK